MDLCTIQMGCKMWNVCRCCLIASGCSRDIFTEYPGPDRSDVYEIMLKDTFSIEMSHKESDMRSNTLICDNCVSRLQEASAFKTMVLRSEQMFEMYLKGSQSYGQSETIKKEDFDINRDEDRNFIEDEPLYVMQQDIKDQSEVEDSTGTKQNHPLVSCTKARRKVKKKSDTVVGDIKSDNDWTKLTEQRGNGPILRENSLKLLENSTIFAFQWYKSKYTCFCCQKPFSNMDELRDHSTEHTLKDIEKKIIQQQNMLIKVEVSILNCKLCCKPLGDLDKLREHLSTDHNFEFRLKEDLLVPFKIRDVLECQICSEQFTVFRLLNIHMNKHYQKQVCHICGAVFSSLKFLNLHKSRLHRRWKCKECNMEFSSKTEKRNHDLTVHKIKSVTKLRFPCPHCDERYYQESVRVLHLVEKHGMRRPEHKCSMCPKTFITKSLCNNHFKSVHKKERKHPCDICNNMFYTKSDVARHRVTHTGEKNFSCALCNGPFATKDSLRRHMKRTHAAVC